MLPSTRSKVEQHTSRPTSFRVLLVEDSEDYAKLVETTLRNTHGAQFDVEHVDALADALERIEQTDFDIMLLDLSLTDSHGLYTVFAACSEKSALPVIVLTATESDILSEEALRLGAEQYLVKDRIDHKQLSGTIIRAIQHHHEHSIHSGNPEILRDAVTGLISESSFWDRLESAVARSTRHQNALAVIYIEFEAFSGFARRFGHDEGNALLRRASTRLGDQLDHLGPNTTLARIGEAGFGLIFANPAAVPDIEVTGSRLRKAITDLPPSNRSNARSPSVSFGIATFPFDGQDPEALVACARRSQMEASQNKGQTRGNDPRRMH